MNGIDNVRNEPGMFKLRGIKSAALFYLTIPVCIFFLGYLKAPIGIPACLVAIVALFLAIKGFDDSSAESSGAIAFTSSTICSVFVFSLLWCIICGQGEFVAQKWDWNFRNACFRDLITHSWPVVYRDFNNALVYYIGHWLPSAAIARLLYVNGGGLECAWPIGNFLLMLWTALGVSISLLLYLGLFFEHRASSLALLLLLFLGFGGLDAAVETGKLYSNITGRTPFSIIENWAVHVSMENKTSQLAWVFHQAVPAWVATLLVVHESKMHSWAFILAMLTLSAPLPSLGLFIMMVVVVVGQLSTLARSRVLDMVKSTATPQNVIGALLVPVIGAYLASNNAAGRLSLWKFDCPDTMTMISFIAVEWGFYTCVAFPFFRANRWFLPTVVALIVASFVHIGARADFSMRASIPPLLLLQVFMAKIVIEPSICGKMTKGLRVLVWTLVIAGFGGAVVDVASTLQRTLHPTGIDDSDQISTFDRDLAPEHIEPPSSWWDWRLHLDNFFVADPQSLFFFKYMAYEKSSN